MLFLNSYYSQFSGTEVDENVSNLDVTWKKYTQAWW